jgi:hypothetical protein
MMRNDEREHRLLSMMSLIFRCRHYDENRHHDESEHNDGRVSPLVNKGEPHFANKSQRNHSSSSYLLLAVVPWTWRIAETSSKTKCDWVWTFHRMKTSHPGGKPAINWR